MANKKEIEVPPGDTDLERTILGSLLFQADLIHEWANDLKPDLFFNRECQGVCKIIIQLYRDLEPVDLLTVVHKARSMELDKLVTPLFISSLTDKICSVGHFEHHFRLLQQLALRRTLIKITSDVMSQSFDDSKDVFDLFADASKRFEGAIKSIVSFQIKQVGEIHSDILAKSKEYLEKGIKSGVESGLTMVDNLTNGWQNSDLIILAGRPSMGKTAAAISMCMYPAIEKKEAIGFFSLEMSSSQLVSRMQSMLSEINVGRIVKKQLSHQEIDKINIDAYKLKDAPIYIDDTPGISLMEFKSKARKMVRENDVKLIIVDYLQLMRSGLKTQSREQEIAEISRALKNVAKELDVPVMALSQLSRAVESRGGDKKPQLSDLRESGQIEQDADMVMFCYRPEYYSIDNYEIEGRDFETNGLFMLLVSKHRNGELGEIPLRFIHEQTKLTNHEFNLSPFEHSDLNSTFVQEKSMSDNALNTNAWIESNKEDDNDIPF